VFLKQIFAHACEHGLAAKESDMVGEWVGGPSSLDLQFAHPSRSALLPTGF
jgi:hypothetical protein